MSRILVIGATGNIGRQVVSQLASRGAHVDTVFLIWAAPPATFTRVLERIGRHARRLVFLSSPSKTRHPLFQQPNPHRVVVEQMEQEIENSGLEWTFLRPGMFAANALGWWWPQIRAGDVVRTGMAERNMF